MSKFTRKEIEDALVAIRADFEERGNEGGFEILVKCEERWAANNHLSDRQLAWLQCQLDGTWKRDAEPGKIVVATKRFDQLDEAIDRLKRAIDAMR